PLGLCCAPNCAGRTCGPDGCGNANGCGACPAGQNCDDDTGQCLCDEQSCADGCCDAGGRCQPGNTEGACGSNGGTCAQCTAQQDCVDGACVMIACTGSCSNDNDCPDIRNCVCNRAQGACCQRTCAGKVCGPDGCGGGCGECPPHATCNGDGACACDVVQCAGTCCAPGQVCDLASSPNRCCTPEPPATTCAGGKCGDVTNTCGQTVNCGACPAQTCRTVVCNATTHVCDYAIQLNGQPGTNCTTQCCSGACCAAGTFCANGQCVVTCGAQVCGPGEICCGNRCVFSGTCCELQLGCDPGTCCGPLVCIPVSPPDPNLWQSMCQLCCEHDSDCPIANTFCSSDPQFCGTANQCPSNSCCQAVGCQNDNECETHICCGRPNGRCCLLGRECVNNRCVVP
ncbi:MAG: hypothetical protein ACRDJC_14245, partial [Thermomicrobiales bacterium]